MFPFAFFFFFFFKYRDSFAFGVLLWTFFFRQLQIFYANTLMCQALPYCICLSAVGLVTFFSALERRRDFGELWQDPRYKALLYLVKSWAKAREINDSSKVRVAPCGV